MKTVPLRYRLPNPPADFVGRQEEVLRLAASLREVHVSVLVGPGGVGKTALVLHTLNKRFPKKIPRILHVSLAGDLERQELTRELLRAVAAAAGADVDWARLQEHGDALAEAVLDLAESGPYWVFVDDLHHANSDEADALLEALSCYARQSRYLVATRIAPQARLASGRVLSLSGLDAESTMQLARQLAEDRPQSEVVAAARASGGSPWLLREALVWPASSDSSPPSQRALLEGLSPTATTVALVLSRIDVPVPPAILSDALDVPEEPWNIELSARGWLQEVSGGVRLHDIARHGITGGGAFLTDPEVWLPVAYELSTSAGAALRLEGIRLLVEANVLDAAERALSDSLDQLVAEGYAPQLWKLLAPLPSTELEGARLRCAAELGNPTILRQVTQPIGGSPQDRLTWAETLYMRGNLAGALETLSALMSETDPTLDTGSTFDAEFLRARIWIAQDRTEDARHLLTTLTPPSAEHGVLRDTLLESCTPLDAVTEGDSSASLLPLQSLEQRVLELRDRPRAVAQFYLAIGYLRRDELEAAERTLDLLACSPSNDLVLFETRCATWLRATIDISRGQLEAAEDRLDQLEPFLSSPSLIRAEIHCTRARLWLAMGRFGDLLPLLRTARAEAEMLGLIATAHRAERLSDRVEDLLLSGEGTRRRNARATMQLEHLQSSALELQRSMRRALASNHIVRGTDARAEYCALLLLLDNTTELEGEAAELARCAQAMNSARWTNEAALLSMFRELDWARLEALAQASDTSPRAARRARALLVQNSPPLGDPLDQAVVGKLQALGTAQLIVPAPDGADWAAGWGFEARRNHVWLPTGTRLDLSRRALLARFLLVLAGHNGSATKQQLVEEVWEEPEYHPLRHDTRLQVTVHKLRELLEPDAGTPRLLLTTQNGYRLAGPFRLVAT